MPDNKINERLLRIRAIDELFSSKPGSTFLPESIISYVMSKNVARDYNRFKLARDIKFLEDDKGVRLKKEQVLPSSGVGRKITRYGYEDSKFSLFHDDISLDDKLLIREILGIFQLKGIDSLTPFVMFDINYGKDVPKNYSPILSFTKDPSEKKISTRLNTLLTSIREKKVIRFKMNDRFDDSKITKHIVHPWYLREYNRRWYLFGWEGNNIEHYALDRMSRISKDVNGTYKCANISIDKILEDVIGINFKKDDKPEDIIFWVSNKSSNFVLSKPMHKTMAKIDYEEVRKVVPEDVLYTLPQKTGVFIKMKCIINYELRREMMSFREELIVLAPNKLRDEIKGILKRMYDNY
ncbi:MAG: WYL domain-containing protein [Muribaculaceae bacterium]|nr:WYL domain-containing protein [Muribaculaceae bacterium]